MPPALQRRRLVLLSIWTTTGAVLDAILADPDAPRSIHELAAGCAGAYLTITFWIVALTLLDAIPGPPPPGATASPRPAARFDWRQHWPQRWRTGTAGLLLVLPFLLRLAEALSQARRLTLANPLPLAIAGSLLALIVTAVRVWRTGDAV